MPAKFAKNDSENYASKLFVRFLPSRFWTRFSQTMLFDPHATYYLFNFKSFFLSNLFDFSRHFFTSKISLKSFSYIHLICLSKSLHFILQSQSKVFLSKLSDDLVWFEHQIGTFYVSVLFEVGRKYFFEVTINFFPSICPFSFLSFSPSFR